MEFTISKKEKKNYEQFTTRFETENMDRLRQISSKYNVSINSLINECVKYALDNMK